MIAPPVGGLLWPNHPETKRRRPICAAADALPSSAASTRGVSAYCACAGRGPSTSATERQMTSARTGMDIVMATTPRGPVTGRCSYRITNRDLACCRGRRSRSVVGYSTTPGLVSFRISRIAVRSAGVRCAYFGRVSLPDSTADKRLHDRGASRRRQGVEGRRVDHVTEWILHQPPLELQFAERPPSSIARPARRQTPRRIPTSLPPCRESAPRPRTADSPPVRSRPRPRCADVPARASQFSRVSRLAACTWWSNTNSAATSLCGVR